VAAKIVIFGGSLVLWFIRLHDGYLYIKVWLADFFDAVVSYINIEHFFVSKTNAQLYLVLINLL